MTLGIGEAFLEGLALVGISHRTIRHRGSKDSVESRVREPNQEGDERLGEELRRNRGFLRCLHDQESGSRSLSKTIDQRRCLSMTIGRQNFRDREKAGEMLNHLAGKHHLDAGKIKLGSFAGFSMELWPDRTKEIILQGKNTYMGKVSDSAPGTIAYLEFTVRSLDDCRTHFSESLSRTKRELAELRPHARNPFEHEPRLTQLVRRQQEIIESLDPTENQAPTPLDEAPVSVVNENRFPSAINL